MDSPSDLAEERCDKIIEWLHHADSSPDKTISWEQAANKIAAHLLP